MPERISQRAILQWHCAAQHNLVEAPGARNRASAGLCGLFCHLQSAASSPASLSSQASSTPPTLFSLLPLSLPLTSPPPLPFPHTLSASSLALLPPSPLPPLPSLPPLS